MKKYNFTLLKFFVAIAVIILSINTTIKAQIYPMGNGNITTCSGTFLDPGGAIDYSGNSYFVQTICSGSGQCIRVDFQTFSTEIGNDFLRVYDGPSISSPLIGIYSGSNIPSSITGNVNSGGCLTFEFISNGTISSSGWSATLSCVACQTLLPPAPENCANAAPFCSGVQGSVTFPGSTDAGEAQPGLGYGCLLTQPNPAWYFLEIQNTGPIQITMSSTPSLDIDYAIWGPFTSNQNLCNPTDISSANQISCGYSGLTTEIGLIPNAISGEFYLFLITNFSNLPCNITFNQTGGSGLSNCAALCSIDNFTLTPGQCDPLTNTFSLIGAATFSNPPINGDIILYNAEGGSSLSPIAPSGTQSFTIPNLPANGIGGTAIVSFGNDGTCLVLANYTAPISCSVCAVTATVINPCLGGNINLIADSPDALPGSTYSWTGPNGFVSSVQNPTISAATFANSGIYSVTVLSGVCSSSATVITAVTSVPVTPNPTNSGPVCVNGILNLTSALFPGVTYNWSGPNGFSSTVQNPILNPVTINDAGPYSLIIMENGCPSLEGTTQVVVNPSPAPPIVSSNSPICEGVNLQLNASPNLLPSQSISWTGPSGFNSVLQNPTVTGAGFINSGNYSAFITQNGCSSLAGTVDVEIIQTPATPIISTNSPVCINNNLTLSPQSYSSPVLYNWIGPNGFTSSASSIAISDAQLTNAGDYSLIVTVQNTTCASAIGNVTVIVSVAPQANAGADISICPQINGNIGEAPTPGVTYLWSPTTGLNDFNSANPIFNLASTSPNNQVLLYTVTASLQNCSTTDQVEITLFSNLFASITAPIPQCFSSNSFSFTAGGLFPANSTFLWDFGLNANPTSSTAQNPNNIIYNFTGQQPVSLSITANGCPSNLATTNINVLPMPTSNFIADNYIGCDPMYVRFTNLSETLNGTLTYQWNLGNGLSSTQTNPNSIYSIPGSYDVKLKVTSSNGCSDVYAVNTMITVSITPEAGFIISPGQNITILDPTINLEDFSVGASQVEYQIDDLDILYDYNPSYTFADTGTYFIKQIVANQFGCADTMVKEVVIDFGFKVFVPKAFSPNFDGKNDFFMVYGEDFDEFEFKVFSRWGQLMFTTFDATSGWDGTIRNSGIIANNDLYIYAVKGTDKYGRQFEVSGTVNLIR